ncbi:hypothetical protein, partial [Escherichia coli]|uniref:hypothetical protein n=3 Tax=Escherichia coli TaxID=562 RepID=UPI0019506B5C
EFHLFIHKAGHFQDFEFIQFFPFSKISPKLFPKTGPRILQHFYTWVSLLGQKSIPVCLPISLSE